MTKIILCNWVQWFSSWTSHINWSITK